MTTLSSNLSETPGKSRRGGGELPCRAGPRLARRDVRQLAALQDLAALRRFLRLCVAPTGQRLNQNSLAGDLRVAHSTVRHWLSVLEASYEIFLLQPRHENFGKRLMKTPKLYLWDGP